jgi:hypothetical protein
MTASSNARQPLVRFGRRQTRGILLGFSGPRLISLCFGFATIVASLLMAGALGLGASMPIWLLAFALAFARWNGDPVAESVPIVLNWQQRKRSGQLRYLAPIFDPRPDGTLALPGDAAALRFYVDDYGRAMIHDPHRRTLSAVLLVSHPAYVLLSPEDQEQRVASWSRVLAGLAATDSCAGLQILESTFPDPGHSVRDWYEQHGLQDDSWADRQYRGLLADRGLSTQQHRTLLVLSLDMRRAARAIRESGRGVKGAANVLHNDMDTFDTSIRAAGLFREGWLEPEDLAVAFRQAYDPLADVNRAAVSLRSAGPVALEEHWDHLRHDSGYSCVLWINEWPRTEVAPHFLHSLVFARQVRKSISILAKPLPTGDALRAIQKEKVEYLTDAHQNDKLGKITDFASQQEYADVLARERALVAGHADLRFAGFIAVTAPTHDELIDAVAQVERAATHCACETRVAFGRQAQAFLCAALPLGRLAF